MRLLFFAAVKSEGNGALSTCSSVMGFCALAILEKTKASRTIDKTECFIVPS